MPAGVVNIVTGERDALVKVLAEHDDVDALWVFGSQEASTAAERLSVGNLKRTLVDHGLIARLVRPGGERRSDPAPPCRAGEEHLDSLWRLETSPCGDTIGIRTIRVRAILKTREGRNMLKGIDPLLNADVLYALRAMGHGDRLVVCDTNFPADSIARQTVFGELLRIDNVSAAQGDRGDPLGAAARYVRRRCGDPHGDRRPAAGSAAGAARGAGRDRPRRGHAPGRWSASSAMPSMRRPRRPIA